MIFQHDKGLKTLLGNLTGLTVNINDPKTSDILISSNAWSFRNRIRQKGALTLPYCSFRLQPGGLLKIEKTFPRNYFLTQGGVWDDDLEDRIEAYAFTGRYEATFWAHKFTNTMFVFQNIFTRNYKDITFQYTYNISGTDFTFEAPFIFTNLEFDPNWTAAEELDRGNMHSIDLSFEIDAFVFKNKGSYGANDANYNTANPVQVTSEGHGLTSGMTVVVGGSTDGEIDGTYTITVIDEDNFTLDGVDNTEGVGGPCDWYSGVSPIDIIELELFYNNGVIGVDDPDVTIQAVHQRGDGIGGMDIEGTFIVR